MMDRLKQKAQSQNWIRIKLSNEEAIWVIKTIKVARAGYPNCGTSSIIRSKADKFE